MNQKLTLIAGMSLCVALTACVDNDYDLSNLDTTVKVPVNDLTIPVNIEPVKLKNIFNLDENDPDNSVKVINGEYAISRDGHFKSDEVKVNEITMNKPVINSSVNIINLKQDNLRAALPSQLTFGIKSEPREFVYQSQNVSSYIQGIDYVSCQLTLVMEMNFRELRGIVNGVSFSNVHLQLPKGLGGVTVDGLNSSYSKETGVLEIPSHHSSDASLTLTIHATSVDVDFMESIGEASFTPSTLDADNGRVSIKGYFYLLDGDLTIKASEISGSIAQIPSHVTMTVDYTPYDTKVTSFTGDIYYKINNVVIPTTQLNDLPDILTQETTNLALQNPQIYLTISNPFTAYDLRAVTGLKITTHRTGKPSHEFTLDENIELVAHEAPNGVFHFVLSPSNPTTRPEGFEDAKWLRFSDLGDLFAGEGLPNEISFDLIDPYIPTQHIEDFNLGVDIGTVNGDYNVLAPLGMKQNSQIVYSDDLDGWESEDLDHCTIDNLSIAVVVSSDIPIDVKLTGYPIDTEGNRIYGSNGQPVNIDGAMIPPMAQNKQINIHTTSTIPSGSKLNGIRFVATAMATEANSPVLNPEMTLTLNNIRVTATGYYIKDLDE